MKRKKTIPVFILSLTVAILSVGLFIFIIRVIENKNISISSTLVIYQSKLKEKEDATIFNKKVSEIKLLQGSMNNRFVDSNKIDTFVGSLENIGSITGSDVSVKSIEVPKETKNIISFKLLISGNFDEVMKTITLLENIPYQVNITRVYLNKDIKQEVVVSQSDGKIVVQEKVSNIPTWKADVSFNILSLN